MVPDCDAISGLKPVVDSSRVDKLLDYSPKSMKISTMPSRKGTRGRTDRLGSAGEGNEMPVKSSRVTGAAGRLTWSARRQLREKGGTGRRGNGGHKKKQSGKSRGSRACLTAMEDIDNQRKDLVFSELLRASNRNETKESNLWSQGCEDLSQTESNVKTMTSPRKVCCCVSQSILKDHSLTASPNDVTTPPHDVIPLPLDPRTWNRVDVSNWLIHMKNFYSIPIPDLLERFKMNGKALCIMNVPMFLYRVPTHGSILYNDFQRRLYRFLLSQTLSQENRHDRGSS